MPAIKYEYSDPRYRCFKFGKKAGREFNSLPQSVRRKMFGTNRIVTSLYTWYDFVPKSIFGQFRRLANFYFLTCAILMTFGTFTTWFGSPLTPGSTVGALGTVMFITMVMQARDDLQRHKSDADVDRRTAVDTRRGALGYQKNWVDVCVGDILIVRNKELLPADLILLTSSEIDGLCYVETSNIDGETNLKLRTPISDISRSLQKHPEKEDLQWTVEQAQGMCGKMIYEQPNNSINTFEAFFEDVCFDNAVDPEKKVLKSKEIAVGAKQLLMRGSLIRNTGWIIGLVVNTGPDTKVARNNSLAPVKLSTLEKVVNKSLRIILGVMAVIVFISTSIYVIKMEDNLTGGDELPWYIFPDKKGPTFDLPPSIAVFLSFIILYNNFVPISMYLSMDIVSYFHAKFINEDVNMYCGLTDTPALCRSMNLCSELGQVQYIFSDKTGTLTQNVMQLKQFSVNGTIYGRLKGKKFSDKRVGRALAKSIEKGTTGGDIYKFLEVMAVAHTVVGEKDEKAPFGVVYQAESPDEGALVGAARDIGLRFVGRKSNTLKVAQDFKAVGRKYGNDSSPTVEYEILAFNDFNSTRKRQSVVAKCSNGEYVLMCKGADNMMFDRASQNSIDTVIPTMTEHLQEFAKEGLRVLVFATRVIPQSEFVPWFTKYEAARVSRGNRKQLLMDVAEELEKDMDIVGASAIEDKLQEGVPEAIFQIRRAGVKLWVLTGDKVETAMNIGYSAKVLSQEMQILVLEKDEAPATDADNKKKVTNFLELITQRLHEAAESPEMVENEMKRKRMARSSSYMPSVNVLAEEKIRIAAHAKANSLDEEGFHQEADAAAVPNVLEVDNLALVVSGPALELVLGDPILREKLLRVGQACNVVLACRVSPLQKALIVEMVKKGVYPSPVTLAIGDGANDVGMIQKADVGIGISGKEGLQAVNSSDFAIAQFRFLERLLLVHGRWNYRRVCKLILFSFYKNIVIGLTMFFYNFSVGFSGTSMYDTNLYSMYNAFLGWGPIAFGVFDKDVQENMLTLHPELYMTGMCNLDLNQFKMVEAVILSLIHSLFVCMLPLLAWNSFDDGVGNGVNEFGTLVYTCLVMTMFYRCLFITYSWNKYTAYSTIFSVLLYIGFISIYNSWLTFAPYYYSIAWNLFAGPITWCVVLSVPIIAASFDLFFEYIRLEYYPNIMDLCVEIEYKKHLENTSELDDLFLAVLSDFGKLLTKPLVLLPFIDKNEEENPIMGAEGGRNRMNLAINTNTKSGKKNARAPHAPRAKTGKSHKRMSTSAMAMENKRRLSSTGSNKSGSSSIALHVTGAASKHKTMLPGTHVIPVSLHTMVDPSESTYNMSHLTNADGSSAIGAVTRSHVRNVSRLPKNWEQTKEETKERSSTSDSFFDNFDDSDTDDDNSGASSSLIANRETMPFRNRPDPRNDFNQQNLNAWQRVITPKWVAFAYACLGGVLFFFATVLGISDLDTYNVTAVYDGHENLHEGKIGESDWIFNVGGDSESVYHSNGDYIGDQRGKGKTLDVNCKIEEDENLPWSDPSKANKKNVCYVDLYFPHNVYPPIFVMYRLSNVHQNYERYYQSRDARQLMGDMPIDETENLWCPDLDVVNVGVGPSNNPATAGKSLYPCGLVANSFFDDEFEIEKLPNDECTCANSVFDYENDNWIYTENRTVNQPPAFRCHRCKVANVTMSTHGIAWETDRRVIQNPVGYPHEKDPTISYPDRFATITEDVGVRDDRYKIWMRPAAMPTFKKAYARIDQVIPENSQLRFKITSRWNVNQFHGSKSLVVSNFSWKGSQDFALPVIFAAISFYCFSTAALIWFKNITCPRQLGKQWAESSQGILRKFRSKKPIREDTEDRVVPLAQGVALENPVCV
eukprot:g1053.t1